MKKKLLAVVISLMLCLGIVGCGTRGDVEPESNDIGNKYIDLVTVYKDTGTRTQVVYDRNTKVMYFIKSSGYKFGITPIYNSDGTVKLYDGE